MANACAGGKFVFVSVLPLKLEFSYHMSVVFYSSVLCRVIESFESIVSLLVLQGNFTNVTNTEENVALVAERVSLPAL